MRQADQEEYARMQYLSGLIAPGMVQQLRVLTDIAVIVGGWASISLEVFLRKDFGERYFTPLRHFLGLFVASSFYIVAGLFYLLLSRFAPPPHEYSTREPAVYFLFVLAYFVFGFWHRFDIWYRNNYENQPWYSRSFGISRPFRRFIGYRFGPLPPLDDWFIYQYIEPGVCFLLGWIMALLGYLTGAPLYTLGLWFIVASFALFAKNQMLYYKERDLFLNMSDSRIMSMNLVASARGAPKEETAGYTVVTLPRALDSDGDGLPDAMQPPPAPAHTPMIDLQAILAANLRPEPPTSSTEARR